MKKTTKGEAPTEAPLDVQLGSALQGVEIYVSRFLEKGTVLAPQHPFNPTTGFLVASDIWAEIGKLMEER